MLSWIKEHMVLVLGFLVVICIFLLYSWIDSRVSLDYARQEQKVQRKEIDSLQRLLLEAGKQMSRTEIEQLVTKLFGKDYIKKEGQDELVLEGGIVLKFKGNVLLGVSSLND